MVAAAVIGCLAGCVTYHADNFSFPGVQCRWLNYSCVVELPRSGYLAVRASSLGTVDETTVWVRFVPRNGIVAAWSTPDITLVDLENNKAVQLKALVTRQVVGRGLDAAIDEDKRIFDAAHAEGQFRVRPRIAKMELRLPPLVLDGETVHVPPVRIDDGFRSPTPTAIYYSH
jgi:hypothetical protein